MALHGPIMVNGESIGHWVARRMTPEVPTDGISAYACEVELYGRGAPQHFRLSHRYDDGAVALAAKVLAECWTAYASVHPQVEDPDWVNDEGRNPWCLASGCDERQNGRHGKWWDDYGTCSRSCAEDYYGEECIE